MLLNLVVKTFTLLYEFKNTVMMLSVTIHCVNRRPQNNKHFFSAASLSSTKCLTWAGTLKTGRFINSLDLINMQKLSNPKLKFEFVMHTLIKIMN